MRLVGEQLSVDGYVRVSRVGGRRGERFISPAVQRELIESWAATRGARVLEVFEELDESGGALIVRCWRRRCGEWRAGSRRGSWCRRSIASVGRCSRGWRRSSGSGRPAGRSSRSRTAWTRARIRVGWCCGSCCRWGVGERAHRASWEQARARAIARGVYLGGRDAPGRLPAHAIGPPATRPDERPGHRGGVPAPRGGETVPRWPRWLEAQGVRTAHGNPGWPVLTTLAKLLAIGSISARSARARTSTSTPTRPLVDAATWQAAQHPERVDRSCTSRSPALLARLVRCAGCSMTMSRLWHRAQGPAAEVSTAASATAPPGRARTGSHRRRCTSTPTSRSASSTSCAADDAPPRPSRPSGGRRWPGADAGVVRATATAIASSTHSARTPSSPALAARTERVRSGPADARGSPRRALRSTRCRPRPSLSASGSTWTTTGAAGRHRPGHRLRVRLAPGQLHVEDRVTVCRAGTAPPSRARGATTAARRAHSSPGAGTVCRRLKPWTTEAHRARASRLPSRPARVADTPLEFAAAGRRRLYDQVVRHAGVCVLGAPLRLADHLLTSRSRESWTEPRIRAAPEPLPAPQAALPYPRSVRGRRPRDPPQRHRAPRRRETLERGAREWADADATDGPPRHPLMKLVRHAAIVLR